MDEAEALRDKIERASRQLAKTGDSYLQGIVRESIKCWQRDLRKAEK